ncbi:MAG: hypothetical protein ACR2QF_15470 [Geminicoccaceae bacterium]
MSAHSDIMPDRQEIWSSIYGAFRLACFDDSGHSHFNLTVEGFWRSFFAAILVAPGHIILASQGFIAGGGQLSVWSLLVHVGMYAVSWIIFPLTVFFAIDLLNLGHRYTALIVAVNWAAVIEISVMVAGLGLALILPPDAAKLLIVAIVIGLVIYQWFVIRTALQSTGTLAFAFVLFALLISVMLEQIANRLL